MKSLTGEAARNLTLLQKTMENVIHKSREWQKSRGGGDWGAKGETGCLLSARKRIFLFWYVKKMQFLTIEKPTDNVQKVDEKATYLSVNHVY